jgi:hypothetical protein
MYECGVVRIKKKKRKMEMSKRVPFICHGINIIHLLCAGICGCNFIFSNENVRNEKRGNVRNVP